MATETEFNAALAQHTLDYNAAFTALNGQITALTSKTVAFETKAEQVRVWKDAIVSGGVVLPPAPPPPVPAPVLNATIAYLKTAMAAAPATHSAIPTTTSGTVILGTIGDKLTPSRIPGANGAYVRHWLVNGNNNGGNNGGKTPDLLNVAKVETMSSLGPSIGGLAELVTADGSSRIKAITAGGAFSTSSGSVADSAIGFTLTGRAFGVSSRFAFGVGHVYVSENGGPLTLCAQKLTWPEDQSYVYMDFGTSATRNIVVVLQAPIEWGDIAVAPDALMSPYDWTAGKFVYSYMGDSWGDTFETVRGFKMPQISGKLLGASHVVGSTIGGTGFIANTGGTQPPATNVTRLAAWTSGTPMLLDCSMMVNDNMSDPAALRAAVDTVLNAGRAACPDALILVTLWASQGSRATNTAGADYQRMVLIRERARLLSGKWIILNALDGIWETSDGTTKATPSGPMITGEGTVASPTGTGNANTWIDEPGGRHPTSAGVIGIANYKALMVKQAIASMTSSATSSPPAAAPSVSTFITGQTGTFELTTTTAVKYGNQSTDAFYQKTLAPGIYTCGDPLFGDPASGMNKSCYLVGTDASSPPQSPVA